MQVLKTISPDMTSKEERIGLAVSLRSHTGSRPHTRSLGFGFELKRRIFGQPAGELISDRLVGQVAHEVVELIGIVSMVVQLFRSVLVDNQSPIAITDGVIAKVR